MSAQKAIVRIKINNKNKQQRNCICVYEYEYIGREGVKKYAHEFPLCVLLYLNVFYFALFLFQSLRSRHFAHNRLTIQCIEAVFIYINRKINFSICHIK